VLNKSGNPPGAGGPPARVVLSSWKEIAEFFQIDVRTCQRWEKAFGLPVHRLDGSPRSRVLAYMDELTEWRSNSYKAKAAVASSQPDSRQAPRRRRFFLCAGLFILSITAVLAGFIVFDRVPDGFRIRGSRLVITNRYGLRLWRVESGLPDLAPTAVYRRRFQNKIYVPYKAVEMPHFPWLIIRDVDGDGKREVLWVAHPEVDRSGQADRLFLFDERGRERWRFIPGAEVVANGRTYSSDFIINILEVGDFDGDGRNEIVLGAHSYGESPTQIVLLDPQRRIRGEYWNFGQLADMAKGDLDGDGKPEIMLVGQNYDWGGPVLLALDPANMKGASPQSPRFKAGSWPAGSQKLYAVFPTLDFDRLIAPRGAFTSIHPQTNGHFFIGAVSLLLLDFAPGPVPPQIVVTDAFTQNYQAAFREHRLTEPFNREAIASQYAAQWRYFDGSAWSSAPVFAGRTDRGLD
jgi:hypothetical protein